MAQPPYRTTQALVQGIITTQKGVDLTPFIATANEITTDICGVYPVPYSDGYVGSRMELIERWLSAHFYSIFDMQLSHAKAGTVAVGYQYKIDLGLKCTMYGQQAIMLDTGGGLAAYDNTAMTKRKINVSIGWLGRKRHWYWDGGQGEWSDMTTEQ